ncbi:MAG: tyrosine-type recombinase/integrase [Nanoarchaeota archaeon]|nr:tyrosine-type recombinase/integrase [Nanoarchaeota archaeon]
MLDFTKKPTTFYFTQTDLKKVLLEVVPHPILLIPLGREELIKELDNYKEKIVGKYITAQQLAYLKIERDKNKEPKYLLEKDLVLLEQYFTKYPDSKIKQTEYAIIKTLAETGCRVSELCDLDVKDVDPDINRVRVIGKGKKWRWIRVDNNIIEFLRSFKQRYHSEKNPFFKNSYGQEYQPLFLNSDGKPFTPRNVQKFMANINTKLPNLSHPLHPHLLRHTYAVLQVLHNPTQSMLTLKTNMGHSDIRTTQIYFSMSEPELERLAKTSEPKKEQKELQKQKVRVESVEQVSDMKFCLFCGKNIPIVAQFCSSCGVKQQ